MFSATVVVLGVILLSVCCFAGTATAPIRIQNNQFAALHLVTANA
jgi:hypothetical protein